ncbi:unnamed protein product [Clonostachys rosea]|uniref:Deacetylase sirtuin-type domain-containing protein n=1 Tax=Bionectria ochroleuca TaxID=29856 RepID=A0ABY6TTS3_BIOOC|nr:unnamed protein product [Clonostachys rosea]
MGQEESTMVDESVQPQVLSERSLEAVADYIKSGHVKRICVMTGAGISTAAGIPDFRSPGTGLYANLKRLNLPHAEAVFDISYFRNNPDPFYVLAQELYPGKFYPTISHAFIALLARKGLLDMLFTQNIDCLERRAGVPADRIVEAHGSFATQRCIDCKVEFPEEKMLEHIQASKVPRCEDRECRGLVKPDIVFFGEPLPRDFSAMSPRASMADLTLILGTSLTVFPFASLPELVTRGKPRVLFNMERVGSLGSRPDDVLALGQCDEGVRKLAKALGWDEELDTLWRNVVGDKEADRQSGDATKQHDELEDEVNKLTEGVESALKLDETADETSEKKDEPTNSASKSELVNDGAKGGEQDEGEILKIPEPREELLNSTEKKVDQSAVSASAPKDKQEEEQNDKAAGPSVDSAEKETRTGEKEGAKQPDPEKAAL